MLKRMVKMVAPNHRLALPNGSNRTYYNAPHLGLDGHMDYERRLVGFDVLLPYLKDRTLLDLGCAEGLILDYLMAGQPSFVHGVDNSLHRILTAKRLYTDPRFRFDVADLNDGRCFENAIFRERYDVIMLIGVYQHLLEDRRVAMLRHALERCGTYFILRLPYRHADLDAPEIVCDNGFEREAVFDRPGGALQIFRRQTGRG